MNNVNASPELRNKDALQRGHPPSSIRCSFFPSCFEAAGFAIYSPKWTAAEVPLCPSWFLSTFIFCRICWTSFRMRSGRMSVLIQYKRDPLAQFWVTGGHPGKAIKASWHHVMSFAILPHCCTISLLIWYWDWWSTKRTNVQYLLVTFLQLIMLLSSPT